jgi:hypothetical protein
MALATGGTAGQQPVSMQTALERLGINPEAEREKRLQWALDEARFSMDVNKKVQALQNTLAEQVQQQLAGAAGLNYDQQAVIGKAEQMVQQLMSLDPNTRRAQIRSLQTEDYVMYSVVIQRLEEMQNAQQQQARAQASQTQGNQLSVRLELQADCFAGIWAHQNQQRTQFLEQGDIEEAMDAAEKIGDDYLQRRATGQVVPDSFTHGSSEQRMHWFQQGLKSGDINQCDTFK